MAPNVALSQHWILIAYETASLNEYCTKASILSAFRSGNSEGDQQSANTNRHVLRFRAKCSQVWSFVRSNMTS